MALTVIKLDGPIFKYVSIFVKLYFMIYMLINQSLVLTALLEKPTMNDALPKLD